MAHDVFISHSSKDKNVADSVCSTLESRGIRCWVAPRDILPGSNWGESIIDAISGCKVMVLVLSSHSNISDQVAREIERAANKGVAILPLRIEDTPLSKSLEYFLSTAHWLDAYSAPLRDYLDHLADSVEQLTSADPSAKGLLPQVPAVTPQPHRGRRSGIGTMAQLALLTLFLAVVSFIAFRGGAEKQAEQDGTPTGAAPLTNAGDSSPGDDRAGTSNSDQRTRSGETKLLGLKSPRMTVEHFRVDPAGTPVRLGRIGTGERRSIQMDDAIRLSLEMDQPQYVSLVAFNPDGGVQLCVPDDETTVPAMLQRFDFPSESDLYFRLTDGRGQQAFLVFMSKEPLPAFATIRKTLEASGWVPNTTGGIWRFDGSKVSQIFSDRTDRGSVQRLTTPHFRSLCTSLVGRPSTGQVLGLAFPVE